MLIKNDELFDIYSIEGVIWDMDGTILDSMGQWDELGVRVLRRKGKEVTPEQAQYLRECSFEESAVFFSEHAGVPGTIEEIKDQINAEMEICYKNEIPIKPGIPELLDFFYRRDIPMCIASSTDSDLIKRVMKHFGLDKYFKAIYSCNDVGKNKSYPDIFDLSLETLGTEAGKTLVIEDSYYAMKTAAKLGYKVMAVYDASAEGDNASIKKDVDVYADSPEELLELI